MIWKLKMNLNIFRRLLSLEETYGKDNETKEKDTIKINYAEGKVVFCNVRLGHYR